MLKAALRAATMVCQRVESMAGQRALQSAVWSDAKRAAWKVFPTAGRKDVQTAVPMVCWWVDVVVHPRVVLKAFVTVGQKDAQTAAPTVCWWVDELVHPRVVLKAFATADRKVCLKVCVMAGQ